MNTAVSDKVNVTLGDEVLQAPGLKMLQTGSRNAANGCGLGAAHRSSIFTLSGNPHGLQRGAAVEPHAGPFVGTLLP